MRTVARLLLGAVLAFAGVSHLTFARQEFQAQVPRSIPIDEDVTVVVSGIVEIALGAALMALPRHRRVVGLVVAAFFVAVFPGNVAQHLNHADGFGLDTDRARFLRLFFQPVLVLWALWSTDALRVLTERRRRGTAR
ncbi:MauE/DoxX family redox-associated membrane protein [Aeromicrobium sp. 179-A 4D2 NHS]|uniref:DoxX family protein n=1 Tax=Aeromicrobium sp. 179-A 4D2 NHS TaxID=3142375 RepID=UPI0039A13AD4